MSFDAHRIKKDERMYWLGFSVFPGIGPVKFQLLLSHFSSAKDAWEAPIRDKQEAIGSKLTEKFEKFRQTFSLEEYAEKLKKKNVGIVTVVDAEYPERLKQIKNPPFVLYVKGNKRLLNLSLRHSRESGNLEAQRRSRISIRDKNVDPWVATRDDNSSKYIAVVGTRKITSYGETVTKLFTESLVASGCVIVSGLALGVDAVAHRTTIENKGKTIAVLGCGVDCCNPGNNQGIYNSIIQSGGTIVSEFPLSQEPTIGSFPSRNRIIAGLSDATLVTEGAEDSGALITADVALKIGRKAFAIPGPITSTLSKGPFKLLRNGGILVTTPEEVIEELGIKSHESRKNSNKKQVTGDNEEEQRIIDLLQQGTLQIDELIKRTGIASAKISAIISIMEIKGMIQRTDTYYSVSH